MLILLLQAGPQWVDYTILGGYGGFRRGSMLMSEGGGGDGCASLRAFRAVFSCFSFCFVAEKTL